MKTHLVKQRYSHIKNSLLFSGGCFGFSLVVQLHRKVEQFVPGLANRFGEGVTNFGNEN